MATLNFPWHLIILLKLIVYQTNSLITNEEIEKASTAAEHIRNPRAIPDSFYIPQPYYRRNSRYQGRYGYQPTYQPWRTTTRRPWPPVWTTRQNIFKGGAPITPRMIYYTRRWRPIQNGSIFKGVTRKDWDRKFQRPTIDPFGNKVTPRRMYYKYLRNRSPIFKEVKQSSAEAFFKRAEQRFIKKYLKPTPFRIFWTQSQLKNPTIATIRPIPMASLKYAPSDLRQVFAPGVSLSSLSHLPSRLSETKSSSESTVRRRTSKYRNFSYSDFSENISIYSDSTKSDSKYSKREYVGRRVSSKTSHFSHSSEPSKTCASHLSFSFSVPVTTNEPSWLRE